MSRFRRVTIKTLQESDKALLGIRASQQDIPDRSITVKTPKHSALLRASSEQVSDRYLIRSSGINQDGSARNVLGLGLLPLSRESSEKQLGSPLSNTKQIEQFGKSLLRSSMEEMNIDAPIWILQQKSNKDGTASNVSRASFGTSIRFSGQDVENTAQWDFDQNLLFDRPHPSRPEIRLSNLHLTSLLGKGQFGVVHRATVISTGEEVALKVIHAKTIVDLGCEELIERERDCMSELTLKFASPFLLKLYNYFGDDCHVYLVIELCLGGSLFDVLATNNKMGLSKDHLRYYLGSIVLGLEAMHSLHILHRDVKPENAILTTTGELKLADFGISKKSKRTFTFCGTPEYMAPEMVLCKMGYGIEVDVWAAGILFFELASGYSPFQAFEIEDVYENILAFVENPAIFTFPEDAEMTQEESFQNLLLSLLHPLPTERITLPLVKTHPYFVGFDWQALAELQLPPPPQVVHPVLKSDRRLSRLGRPTPTTYDAKFSDQVDVSGWSKRF